MTIWPRKHSKKPAMDEPPTRIRSTPVAQDVPEAVGSPPPQPAPVEAFDDGEPETLDMDVAPGTSAPATSRPTSDEPATTIAQPHEPDLATAGDAMDDPPAGFLVIVNGPGKGRFVAYGYGVNTIGRGAGQRVRIDFGDPKISRENHAQIVFDPKTRGVTLRHEMGANLTYLNGEAVLAPMPVAPRGRFQIGDTHVMVVPLCDTAFDWENETEEKAT